MSALVVAKSISM